ncbi:MULTISPECIES: DMSO/selenate family reductase complex B subunit [unclassified Shewanella]|uniref:DMSO/selenate family reductase complex B subunit n=1 Tax=unclassified Shewanella TaxID=196818 RepID=UPI000C850FD2|nr:MULTISPECIES: DMSO/selenate family reductase complex B subunit [unclassified Shewanella]MDO6678069.1 dimethylsulfoxide reductase subunit B [Shewanella sp. 4_MG-2023]MDO6775060.1 dimethylsulfoxide reductase subunit B [Shewanella sp. 3_MG-2023]PMG30463.1 dimethylsulfoxide reductase, chain B [Shewanella sp. 10N.286.52.C2]PMG49602.1 dimethylsulfoxide reductase, chain B [Shewanella sp. 10N.286.52.B9]
MNNSTQYGFHIDTQKCSGCKTCQISCKDKNDIDIGPLLRRTYKYGGGSFQEVADGVYINDVFAYYVSISCNHCNTPVCVKSCPTGAMHKRREDGLVDIATDLCIGCSSCARACPYDAPQLDTRRKVMTKCDGCKDRIALGKKPSCVESCPQRALDFDTIDILEQKYPEAVRGEANPLPSSSITDPNLLITVNRYNDRSDGSIQNINEV